jgi:inner membrane protein
MDPLSQAVLGGAAAQSAGRHSQAKLAGLAGIIGGLAPDLDVLIRSSTDPMLGLLYHRHFTHALAFIPVGGALCGVFTWLVLRRRYPFALCVLFATLGYATHGLLDAFTSYGTLLLWPFNTVRYAWDGVSIINPLFTLPLLAGVVWSYRKNTPRPARLMLLFGLLYLGFGLWQNARVRVAVAADSGIATVRAMPMLGQPLGFRVVYRDDTHVYMRGAVAKPWAPVELTPAQSLPRLDVATLNLPEGPLKRDVAIFNWFTDGYLAAAPSNPNLLGDMRYSFSANGITPLWGLRIDPTQPGRHAERAGRGEMPPFAPATGG